MDVTSALDPPALTYAVASSPTGWTVWEDDEAVSQQPTKVEALETAVLLTIAAKALGRPAKLLAPTIDGQVECVDVNQPLSCLGRFVVPA